VIHRKVNLPTHVFIVPQQANYEENLEPAPPLIIPLKSKRSSSLTSTLDFKNKTSDFTDHPNEKSEIILPFHSSTILSPIEEESEEVEPTYGIAFNLLNQDLLPKKHPIDVMDNLTERIHHEDDEIPSEKLSAPPEMLPTSSHILQPVEETEQQKINEDQQVTFQCSIKSKLLSLH
jgi:hypothetical protein